MKTKIEKCYETWCGTDYHLNDCHPVHDSSETMEFAEQYFDEMQKENPLKVFFEVLKEIRLQLTNDYCDKCERKSYDNCYRCIKTSNFANFDMRTVRPQIIKMLSNKTNNLH